MSSVQASGPEPVARRSTWWSATVQWRNWPLLVKLGVVLVVPVVSALVLGVLRVEADVSLARSYSATERVAALRTQFVSVLAAVERERNEALRAGGQLDPAAKATDRAVAAMKEVVRRDPGLGDPTSGYGALVRALDTLPLARRQVTSGADGLIVLSAYNAVVNPVLEYDRSLVGRFPAEDLAATSLALSELQGMSEQVALQQVIGNMALRDRVLPDAARQLLLEADVRFDDKLEDFQAQAPPALATRYQDAVEGDNVIAYLRLVDALRTTDPAALPFNQEQWNTNSNASFTLMTDLTRQAANSLRSDSAALAESVSNRAGLESVLLLSMVLLAAGIGGGLGRYLLRSVGLLRRTALAVANERLPAAVVSIRAGEKVEIEPVPLRSTEEFGQLARAFDAVNGQAVRSAAEEASLRSNLANIFTNLSRRSQGLVERQLRLMEQLEQKTEDPDQLENLFKIDHLATRMRRNNENLMVLSGTGLLRRFAEPMPLPDVLRAAISEVEHYQRAVVRSVPDVRIAGYAAGDLIRSISELIENATAFSPPDAQVTVVSRLLQDGSAVVDIVDKGVGMGEKELAEANQKITGGGGVDVPISRQMGLFVVGRLTARHGIHVRLIPRVDGGLCASVLVPAGLVNIGDPGQTAAFELPSFGQDGPASAAEWSQVRSVAAVDEPDPGTGLSAPTASGGTRARGERTDESWLTTAAGQAPADRGGTAGSAGPERSVAASWLQAAKKAESGDTGEFAAINWLDGAREQAAGGPGERPAGPNWLEAARGGAQAPAHTGEPPTAANWLEAVKKAESTTPGDAAGWPAASGDAEPPAVALPDPRPAISEPESPKRPEPGGLPKRIPGRAAVPAAYSDDSRPPAGRPAATKEPEPAPGGEPEPAGKATNAGRRGTSGAEAPAPGAAESTSVLEPVRSAEGAGSDERTATERSEPAAGDDAPTQVGLPAVVLGETAASRSLPSYEEFEPVEVARQLESAGIAVTLPEFPAASTPASILFADNTMGGDGGEAAVGREPGFSWLRTRAGAPARPPRPQPPEPPVVTTGPAGLPKRVPRGHLQGAAPRGQSAAPAQPPAATRDAARARGFMSGFQAGIRQSENREGESGS
ncbi:nitrate- and nitrite sensing domain-containing protein [Actinophytocola sp.]|uniref:sensor histidine kinase n=1 Tax=Actinophytocola sp. TaxID=1872138 RepID=UPI002D507F5B|nr:nitrate- and nitrite sensing domain-containing protein [Actinophytocola sp.]HYQ69954.1 nitrate- and nitrite sensing domain-containing protein [Actinophytocola sp.]